MKADFENIYDAYCPVLYSIALQLCPTEEQAEEILVETFKKMHSQKSVWQNNKWLCIPLIKILIDTAKKQSYPAKTTIDVKVKQFKNTPLLHQLLVDQLSIENYCSKNDITREEVALKIRQEFMMIRNLSQQTNIKTDSSAFTAPQLNS